MRQNNISQIPVVEDHKSIGMVSEAILLDALMKDRPCTKVKDVMKDSPPVVNVNANGQAVYSLLHFYPIVLVAEKGKK